MNRRPPVLQGFCWSSSLRFYVCVSFLRLAGALLMSCLTAPQASARDELQRLTDRLLAPPSITAEAGFTVTVLVPPGHLYDPLWLVPRDGVVWLNDDGGEEGAKGSRLFALDQEGRLSTLIELGKLLPVTGFDVAPASFGPFAGQIFTLAQAQVAVAGATANHIIQRVDPGHGYEASVFCTLPSTGQANEGVSGFGVDARFGPEGTPFAGKFFAVTAYNSTIYQVTPDGVCTPFVTFDGHRFAAPAGLGFALDGKTMLVTVSQGDIVGTPAAGGGAVVRVSPTGQVESQPFVRGLTRPMGLDFAPPEFRSFAGQLFVTDMENIQVPVPMTQPLAADGKLYRITADGTPHLVASGFFNPVGVRFLKERLWVTDINGDFIAGKRELPDGFLVEIRAH